jgi:hypothetical protein
MREQTPEIESLLRKSQVVLLCDSQRAPVISDSEYRFGDEELRRLLPSMNFRQFRLATAGTVLFARPEVLNLAVPIGVKELPPLAAGQPIFPSD